MADEKPCVFCKIIKGEISCDKVWENKEFIAFLDINPVIPGHLMIIPRRHVDYFFDLNDQEYSEIFRIAKNMQGALKKVTNSKRIGLVVEGFAVPHAHLHLVPLYKSNDIDPCQAKPGVPAELKAIAEKIRLEVGRGIMKGNKI